MANRECWVVVKAEALPTRSSWRALCGTLYRHSAKSSGPPPLTSMLSHNCLILLTLLSFRTVRGGNGTGLEGLDFEKRFRHISLKAACSSPRLDHFLARNQSLSPSYSDTGRLAWLLVGEEHSLVRASCSSTLSEKQTEYSFLVSKPGFIVTAPSSPKHMVVMPLHLQSTLLTVRPIAHAQSGGGKLLPLER